MASNCAFCGKPHAHYGIKTGVSAYLACLDCATEWKESDHTREALEELRQKGAIRTQEAPKAASG